MHRELKQIALMMIDQAVEETREIKPGARLFIVFDPSRDTKIETIVQGLAARAECLYVGHARLEFGEDAPWLAEAADHDGLKEFFINEGLGARWGIMTISEASFEEVYRHFKKLVKVRRVSGEALFFRFFDPDVLGSMLPFMTGEQREFVFGPLQALLMEITAGSKFGFGRMDKPQTHEIPVRMAMENPDDSAIVHEDQASIGDAAASVSALMNFDLSGATTKPGLTLTQAQMDAPILFNRAKLIASTVEHLEQDFGSAMKVMPPTLLAQNINHGIDLAMSYRIFDVAYVHLFVELMMRIAPGWHREPKLASVLTMDAPPDVRFEKIIGTEYDTAWEKARTYNDVDEWIEDREEEKKRVH